MVLKNDDFMNRLPIHLYCLLVFIFLGQGRVEAQAGFNIQKGGHAYKIEIPEYMQRVYDLNDVASIQYMDASKPAYTIVIEDSKEELAYFDIRYDDAYDFINAFLGVFKADVSTRRVGKLVEFEAGGVRYAQTTMKWEEEDQSLYMLITVLESPTHFYKILSWTTQEWEQRLKDDFQRISLSLREY
jgi:hypothetical protein